jgi:hypothetical protein
MEPDQASRSAFFDNGSVVDWVPTNPQSQASSQLSDVPSDLFDTDSQESSSDGIPKTDQELRTRFAAFIRKRIRSAKDKDHPEAGYNISKKGRGLAVGRLYSLLGVVHDPTSILPVTNVEIVNHLMKLREEDDIETLFDTEIISYINAIETIENYWMGKKKTSDAVSPIGHPRACDTEGTNDE